MAQTHRTPRNQPDEDPKATEARNQENKETADLQAQEQEGTKEQVEAARQTQSGSQLPNPSDVQSDVVGPTHPALNPQSLPIDASWSANQGGPDELHNLTQDGILHGLGAPEILRLQQQAEADFPSNPMVPPEVVKATNERQARIDHVRRTGREMSVANDLELEDKSPAQVAREKSDADKQAAKDAKDAEDK